MNHKLDTDEQVFFYEQEFYVLSNFSAFAVRWQSVRFDTVEAAYHWEKFPNAPKIQERIRTAASAHDALQIAREWREYQRPDWDEVKVGIMRRILRQKVLQHPYVHRKLMETGDRVLVEDSWRDDFWGWGPNRDGQNVLGKLWMEVRDEFRSLERLSKSVSIAASCDCFDDGIMPVLGSGCTIHRTQDRATIVPRQD